MNESHGELTSTAMDVALLVTDRDGREHSLRCPPGGTLMEVLRDEDLGVAAICGGMMSCATCHVYLGDGWQGLIAPPSEDEEAMLRALEHHREGRSRLSCQIPFMESLTGLNVTIAPEP